MKRVHVLLLAALGLSLPAMAQHAFYKQLLDEGETAMSLKNWEQADRLLEIAAFGFLDHPELLAGTYMRLAIVADQLKDNDKLVHYVSKVKRTQDSKIHQPEGLSDALWNTYQVLTGMKKPPPPPIPSGTSELQSYVKKYPDNEDAWIRLVDSLKSARGSEQRDVLEDARKAHPRSVPILEQALTFAVEKDRGRNAKELADELLALEKDASLACEVLGNLAMDAKDYEAADSYYKRMKRPSLDQTDDLQRKLKVALDRIKDKDQKEAEKKAKEDERIARKKQEEDKAKEEAARKAELVQAKADEKAAEKKKAVAATTPKKSEKKPARNDASTQVARATPKKEKKAEPKKEEVRPTPKPEPKPVAQSPLELAEEAVAANPKDASLKYTLIDEYFKERDLKKARKVLTDLGEQDSQSPHYAAVFARYNYLKGKFKDNVKLLGSRKNLTEDGRYYLGMSYFRMRKYEEADQLLKDLDRNRYPDLQGVDSTLDTKLSKNDRHSSSVSVEEASPVVKKAEEPDVDDILRSGSLNERLAVFEKLAAKGDWNKLRRPVKKASSEAPRNQDVLYYRARLYLEDGDYKKASNLFYNLSSTGYKNGEVLYYGGLAAHKNGDLPLAGYLFRRAKIAGTQFESEIESMLDRRPKTEEAHAVYSKEIEVKMKDLERMTEKFTFLEPKFALMRMYGVTGNAEGFEKLKNELTTTTLSPKYRDLLLAWNLCKFKHYDEALTALNSYVHDEATFLKAYIYHLMGEKAKAAPLFERLKSHESFPEVAVLMK